MKGFEIEWYGSLKNCDFFGLEIPKYRYDWCLHLGYVEIRKLRQDG